MDAEHVAHALELCEDARQLLDAGDRQGRVDRRGLVRIREGRERHQRDLVLADHRGDVAQEAVPVPALDPDGCGRYVYVQDRSSTDQQYISRLDFQVTQNKRVFFRDFLALFNDPPAFDQSKPNLLDASAGNGNKAYQHTIATGLDYVINEHLFSSTRVSYQNTHAERTNGEGVPTLAMLGVKSWMYTQGKIPGQDMLQAGLWGAGFTGNFYVNTPQFSQDFDW